MSSPTPNRQALDTTAAEDPEEHDVWNLLSEQERQHLAPDVTSPEHTLEALHSRTQDWATPINECAGTDGLYATYMMAATQEIPELSTETHRCISDSLAQLEREPALQQTGASDEDPATAFETFFPIISGHTAVITYCTTEQE